MASLLSLPTKPTPPPSLIPKSRSDTSLPSPFSPFFHSKKLPHFRSSLSLFSTEPWRLSSICVGVCCSRFSFPLRRRRVGSPAMTSDLSGESKLWGKDEIFLVVHESSSFFQPPFAFSQLPFPFSSSAGGLECFRRRWSYFPAKGVVVEGGW